ncbi:MAG: MFS transporter [Promicromonosporaceae bacterium]|nr:MFS transporter [Promicromonosporaceae bacterium]
MTPNGDLSPSDVVSSDDDGAAVEFRELPLEDQELPPEDNGPESEAEPSSKIAKTRIRAWAMWDWSTQPFNSVLITFVFIPLYLTSAAFLDPRIAELPPADPIRIHGLDELAAGVGGWMTIAGIGIALLAPVLGQRADASGRRKVWLGGANLLLVLIMAALFFVRADPAFFALGAALMAFGSVIDTVANVNYNALINSVSTPKTIGRISGLGWGLGYLGGIVALVIVVVLEMTGWFGIETAYGLPFRLIALGCAVWAVVFGWPVYRYVPEPPVAEGRRKVGWGESYVLLFRQVRSIFYTSRSTFWFLIASAIYRDGLSGIFTFGAVIAAVSFGFGVQEVMIFGIVANLVAGVSTILVGRLDDYWGARRVIILSLTVLIVAGSVALALNGLGPIVFWIFGLILCATVGPAQAASRSYLARVAPPGHESEIFGLYATSGKAASFMSAGLWTIFITTFGATIWGLLGILLVIATGLTALILLVKTPPKSSGEVGSDHRRRAVAEAGA